MLILSGQIIQVSPKEKRDFNTGEISNIHTVTILHNVSSSPTSEAELEKISIKHSVQAEAFQKLKGQNVSFPVRMWATEKGAKGLWLPEGALPTPQRVAPAA